MRGSIITYLIFILLVSNMSIGESKNNVLIVIGDNLNLREEPKLNSKIIRKLRITWLVKLIKKTDKTEKIKNIEGKWAFINTGLEKGWVFDYYLANEKDFKKVKSFRNTILEGEHGDHYIYFEFKKNGQYRCKKEDKNKNLFYEKGKLYKYRNIFLAYNDNEKSYSIFYLNKKNKICSAIYFDEKGNDICE